MSPLTHFDLFPLLGYTCPMGIKKQNFTPVTQVRPDSKGRITLSKLTEGISSFNVSKDEDGRILLEPMVEIPAREKWLDSLTLSRRLPAREETLASGR